MPAPLTSVAIVNRALASFGAGAITTMTQATPPGPTVALIYRNTIDLLLSEHPWSFCRDMVPLNRLTDETADASGLLMAGFRYVHALPPDRLALPDKYLDTRRDPDDPVKRFYVNNDRVYSDEEELWALVRLRKDEAEWPAYFVAAAVAACAAEMVIAISGNSGLYETLQVKAYGTPSEGRRGGLLGAARMADGRSDGGEKLALDALVGGWRND